MADLMDKAQAIWKALDEMVDKDPEAYKKFMNEQLSEGEKLFKEMGLGDMGKGPWPSSLGGNSSTSKKTGEGPSEKKTKKKGTKGDAEETDEVLQKMTALNVADEEDKLLDNQIGKCSVIAGIVNKDLIRDQPDDDEDSIPQNIQLLPCMSQEPKKNGESKPLIQEL